MRTRSIATLALGVAAGCFVTTAFLGTSQSLSRTPARAIPAVSASFARPTTVEPVASPDFSKEAGQQIAIATLVSGSHQIDDTKVTFYAEPQRSGNALQQFAEVFGSAIAERENPRPIRAPLRQPKGGM